MYDQNISKFQFLNKFYRTNIFYEYKYQIIYSQYIEMIQF